jgi:hypothetical protein
LVLFFSIVQEILERDTSQANVKMLGDYAPIHLAANDGCVENIRLLVLLVSLGLLFVPHFPKVPGWLFPSAISPVLAAILPMLGEDVKTLFVMSLLG